MNHDHSCNGWSWITIDWILDQKSYELLWTAFGPAGMFQCLFGPCNSKWGLWTHSISITWEPLGMQMSNPPPTTYWIRVCVSVTWGLGSLIGDGYILNCNPCSPIHVLRSIRTLVQGFLTSDISCLMIWGGTEVIIVEIKCTINVLESSPKPPAPPSLEKLSSMKLISGAKEVALIAQNVTSLHIRSLWFSLGKMRSLEWALI